MEEFPESRALYHNNMDRVCTAFTRACRDMVHSSITNGLANGALSPTKSAPNVGKRSQMSRQGICRCYAILRDHKKEGEIRQPFLGWSARAPTQSLL